MAVKSFKPTSPGRRFMTVADFSDISKAPTEKKLLKRIKRNSGRNNQGRITIRFRGGGARKIYRVIDFKRDIRDIPARVEAIEYDPNRTCRIALLYYKNGVKRYILAPDGLKVGDTVISSENADIKVGNALPLRNIPVGQMVHNIELKIGKGGALARAAGTAAQVLGKEGNYAILRLPSGEMRKVLQDCYATIGQVGNLEYENIIIGKAGRNRHKGRKPHVRGAAMNPVDHPHGGGEGKAGQGNPHPVSPWGWKTKGFKTRHNKRTEKYIIKHRR
ncbi:MAG: 50S ribosomal protein L2 [Deltaproteobacteria bacterium]|nr:50S ribosomal protein L2 [Deltaproteobacteria bacterium]